MHVCLRPYVDPHSRPNRCRENTPCSTPPSHPLAFLCCGDGLQVQGAEVEPFSPYKIATIPEYDELILFEVLMM